MTSESRTNILLITTDQHRADCFGFAGRRVLTPHLDRLAAGGTQFSTCTTPSPVCAPARASILTGLLPLTHGVLDNGIDLDPAVAKQGFAASLARIGYRTALIGKAHFATKNTFHPTGSPESMEGSRELPADWSGPYCGFDHVELALFGHLHSGDLMPKPPRGLHYEDWFHNRLPEGGAHALWRDTTRPRTGAHQTWSSSLPVAWHTSTWVADRTIAQLQSAATGDSPFCIWASFPDPHPPFDCPEPWASLHKIEEADLPTHRARDLDRRPWYHQAFLEGAPEVEDARYRHFRLKGSRAPQQTDLQLADMTANYFGMIALVDHSVGRILSSLDDLGLAANTLVIFTSDHGDYLGDHGLCLKGPAPYEGLIRVGMIANGPGVAQGGVVDEPVSTLDLHPTFLDLAGAAIPSSLHGQSLRPLLGGHVEQRAGAYTEWRVAKSRFGHELDMRTVRTRSAKLTVECLSGDGELYDLADDPNEMNNLYDRPHAHGLRQQLEELLAKRPDDIIHPLPKPVGIG